MTVGPPRSIDLYPFARLDEVKKNAGLELDLIDFGMGDPREATPPFIRQAMIDSIGRVSSYPKSAGSPELRRAISQWIARRFDATVDADTQIMPTLGAKEIIHSLPAYALEEDRNLVLVPSPAYPVYDRGARFHGGEVFDLTLTPENHYLPDLMAVSVETWRRTALVWLNYPNNPTGACAPLELYEQAASLARKHGFLLASDEAYSEIYFGDPPPSALQLDDLTNVVVINTLSKRSCMTGYRSGFIAGDPSVVESLRRYRPSVGVTPQDFVQSASVDAWNDEGHVAELRAVWEAKRRVIADALDTRGIETHSQATFFLWLRALPGDTSEQMADRFLKLGIIVAPGNYFGAGGEGFVRLALVPSLDSCTVAAERILNATWDGRST